MIAYVPHVFLLMGITCVSSSIASSIASISLNEKPVILIPGVFGWGRGEMMNVYYFGMLSGDIQEELKSKNYTVFTTSPGPASSHWDRACEMYAMLKGGIVDYGKGHAHEHRHKQFGRWVRKMEIFKDGNDNILV